MTVTNMLVREHLLDRLRLFRNFDCLVLVSPAGSGKTVLVEQFTQEMGLNCLTLSAPYLGIGHSSLLKDLCEQFSIYLNRELSISVEFGYEYVFQQLSNYLQSSHSEKFVVVVDNVHNMLQTHEFFESFLRHFQGFMSCILVSREYIPLNYDTLKEAYQVEFLEGDFYFSKDEMSSLPSIIGKDIDNRFLDAVWERFHGWPIVTMMALRAGVIVTGDSELSFVAELVAVILSRLTDTQRIWLMSAAVLPEVNALLCTEILGIDEPNHFIEVLRMHGLFAGTNQRGFLFHNLVRTHLLAELEKRDSARLLSVNKRLALWYVQNFDFELAVRHFVLAKDVLLAINLIFDNRSALRTFSMESLNVLFAKLVNRDLRSSLWEKYGLEFAKLLTELAQLFYQYRTELRDVRGYSDFLYLMLAVQEDSFLSAYPLYRHDFDVEIITFVANQISNDYAIEILDNILASLDNIEMPEYLPTFRLVRPFSLVFKYLRAYYLADYESALQFQLEAFDGVLDHIDDIDAFELSYYFFSILDLAAVLSRESELSDKGISKQIFAYFERYIVEFPNSPLVGRISVLLSNSYLSHGRYGLSSSICFRALELPYVDRHSIYMELCLLSVLQGNKADLFKFMKLAAKAFRRASSYNALAYHANLLQYHFWIANENDAEHYLKELHNLAEATDNSFFLKFAKSYEFLLKLRPWNILEQRQYLMDELLENRAVLVARFLMAAYESDFKSLDNLYRDKDYDIFWKRLCSMILVYRDMDVPVTSLWWNNYQECLVSYRRYEQVRVDGSPIASNIYSHLLGKEVLKLDGQFLRREEWYKTQNRQVFYHLLIYGAASVDRLATVFWGDKDSERAHDSLRKAVQWLNDFFGFDIIVNKHGQYMINPVCNIESDILELRRLYSSSDLSVFSSSKISFGVDRVYELLEHELVLEADTIWVEDLRRDLETWRVAVATRYSRTLMTLGDYIPAMRFVDFVLKLDRFFEEAWRLKLELYFNMGERAKMALLYREMNGFFLDEFGLLPSLETRELYSRLLLQDEGESEEID